MPTNTPNIPKIEKKDLLPKMLPTISKIWNIRQEKMKP